MTTYEMQRMLGRRLDSQGAAEAACAVQMQSGYSDPSFKNFHRLLCERFGYVHDEKDWQRDQLSLIEHIATKVPRNACGAEMSAETNDVTHEYKLAEAAVADFNPGIQPDIGKLLRAAYIHGYAKALIDYRERLQDEPTVRVNECICPTCGLRHGGSNADGGF